MRIAIDFDGVLCDTIQKWVSIFNSDYSTKYNNLKLSYNTITEFNFWNHYGITNNDALGIFAQCWESWDTLHPTEFSLHQKTGKLSELCDTMDVVTANDPSNKEYLEKFLEKYSIKYDSIVFEENKETLHYNTFIDDSSINAQKIFDAGKSTFLYNQPWNRDIISQKTETIHLSRVYGLDHIIHILQNT